MLKVRQYRDGNLMRKFIVRNPKKIKMYRMLSLLKMAEVDTKVEEIKDEP